MSARQALRPAVFVDRDGTINEDVDFLTDPGELQLFPGSAEALAALARAGFGLVVITNQSGVARGLLTEDTLAAVHAKLEAMLAEGGARVDRIAYCPHHPTEGAPPYRRACDCRKPAPGLLARAIADLALDPAASWVVGDSERDLEAGAALGIPGILVATGKGTAEHARLAAEGRAPERFVPDLAAAAELILANSRRT